MLIFMNKVPNELFHLKLSEHNSWSAYSDLYNVYVVKSSIHFYGNREYTVISWNTKNKVTK